MQQSAFIGRYLPQRFSDRNGQCEKGYFGSSVLVGLNNVIAPAVAGKCIYVPWIVCYGSAVNAYITFKTASGGKLNIVIPPDSKEIPNIILPFNEDGWIDTLPGESLLLDVFATNCVVSLKYYYYLP